MTYAEWRGVVDSHYGGLHMFRDATTVRHYFHAAERQLIDLLRLREDVRIRCGDKEAARFGAMFEPDLAEYRAALSDLYAWLTERGLKP